MKHVLKILSLLLLISALWISLLLASIIPQSHTWLVTFFLFALDVLFQSISSCSNVLPLYTEFVQLPIYFIVLLGCYGLLLVGIGLMRFPTCPEEALLLQKDIAEAKDFLKQRGIDICSD